MENFKEKLSSDFITFIDEQKSVFPIEDTLKIDLHCHDYNSSEPDELYGRLLQLPETWLSSEELLTNLSNNGCTACTITNHNNATSCFDLIDKGYDILVGAEFSCFVPDFEIGIHVLAYGFNRVQETRLNKLRKDIYRFVTYAKENDIPLIWAHPLYHYHSKGNIPKMDFFYKMSLIFERFEAVNGQRNIWQNMLVKTWIDDLTKDKIDEYAKTYDIDITQYCKKPYEKIITGGSDDHMGIFAGLTGSIVYIPNLEKQLEIHSKAELVLSAIKNNHIVPFGSANYDGNMSITFLSYICQVGINMKDPGLIRLLLHKGSIKDKLISFVLGNGFLELSNHKLTKSFMQMFQDSLTGKKTAGYKKFFISKEFKEIFDISQNMAEAKKNNFEENSDEYKQGVRKIYDKLIQILLKRSVGKYDKFLRAKIELSDSASFNNIMDKIEIPLRIKSLFEDGNLKSSERLSNINFQKVFDGLSFPFLASSLIVGANFANTKVLYNSRELLNTFSEKYDTYKFPKRVLWLTDTFNDKNGVSFSIKSMLKEVQRRDLPIDFLVCGNDIKEEPHLIVVPALEEMRLHFYKEQPIRIPNILDIDAIFAKDTYDRIICSTEGIMGLISIYLKNAYSVKAHFFVHTDWMMFARKVLNFKSGNRSRLRRMIRAYYNNFDSLFVLNGDQQKWFSSENMGFENVHLTAHWIDGDKFSQKKKNKEIFGLKPNSNVVLFSGRISYEKGVMELPEIYRELSKVIDNLEFVFAGVGPLEEKLKEEFPQGKYLGWVESSEIADVYSSADILILPSKFDTFGRVVLEALCCGLPVVAYNTKGPKDIILHNENGYLVKTIDEIVQSLTEFFSNEKLRENFSREALKRTESYNAEVIMDNLLKDIGM